MKTVNAKGKLCPMPLILTKKALLEINDNENLRVLVDNETSMKNVKRFLEDHRMDVTINRQGSIFEILVNKTGNMDESVEAEAYCAVESPAGAEYVISLQKDHLGDGDPELGKILMKAFVNTLPEVGNKPGKMVFLNSGILLAVSGSPVLEALQKLEKAGMEILICGTCLDFYGKKDELAVGQVSNMYDILDSLSRASKVIYP